MQDIKKYLSVAPVISTLWFGSLAGLGILFHSKACIRGLHAWTFKKKVYS